MTNTGGFQGKTSEVLSRLRERNPGEPIAIGTIDTALEERSFGLAMLVFALPCCIPMPPGIPTLCGIALMIISVQMMAQRARLWLPKTIARREISHRQFVTLLERIQPIIRRLERLCRPRAPLFVGRFAETAVGLIVFVLGFVLVLPIPFLGNMPPGLAVTVLAVGLLEQDGLVVGLGLLASAVAFALTAAMTWAAIGSLVRYLG